MRTCRTCGQSKPLTEFYVMQSPTRTLPCKPCQRAKARDHYARNAAAVHARIYARDTRDLERQRALCRAREAVGRAVKLGVLIKSTACEECGVDGDAIEGAHADYLYPIAVRWLCRPCHRSWDKRMAKWVPGRFVPAMDAITVRRLGGKARQGRTV